MKIIQKIFMSFVALTMCLFVQPLKVNAEDTTTFTTNVLFHQTEARKTLDLVNEFRTGPDAWYWERGNESKAENLGLQKFEWNAHLEKLVMQRAVEAALKMSHTRPDGTSCFTVDDVNDYFTFSLMGENLAITYESAELVVDAWKETYDPYEGQGHRRNLLSNAKYYAAACVEVDGVLVWAEEFANGTFTEPLDEACDTYKDETITIQNSNVSTATITGTPVQLDEVGDTCNIAQLSAKGISTPESLFSITFDGKVDSTWTSNDSSIVAVEDGKAVAKGIGKTKLTTTAFGKTYSIDAVVGSVIMNRLYNPNSGEHFYTAKPAERDMLVGVGWKFEGTGWYAPKNGKDVYRLYNPNAGDHHYTLNEAEKDMLVKVGWNDEGVGWCSDVNETTPLFREYNPNADAGAHNYTTNKAEHNMLVGAGWHDEDIAWYGM